jgi:hypothetical protein
LWGSEHPAFARTLESVAGRYIIELRLLGRAHELMDQAAQIISASDGETPMRCPLWKTPGRASRNSKATQNWLPS